jgi:hypothetical protein
MELGGVEYLVNERDGLPYIYDVNALSNVVANARRRCSASTRSSTSSTTCSSALTGASRSPAD